MSNAEKLYWEQADGCWRLIARRPGSLYQARMPHDSRWLRDWLAELGDKAEPRSVRVRQGLVAARQALARAYEELGDAPGLECVARDLGQIRIRKHKK